MEDRKAVMMVPMMAVPRVDYWVVLKAAKMALLMAGYLVVPRVDCWAARMAGCLGQDMCSSK